MVRFRRNAESDPLMSSLIPEDIALMHKITKSMAELDTPPHFAVVHIPRTFGSMANWAPVAGAALFAAPRMDH